MEQRNPPSNPFYKPNKPVYKKPKDPLSPWKSAWFITINTNQTSFNPKPLQIVWQYILENITSFAFGRGFITHVYETGRVIEKGTKKGRIHLHTKVQIDTNGIAFLDFVKIQKFINKQLFQIPSFKGIYFNARIITNFNQATVIQEYLEKDPYIYNEDEPTDFKIIS
jgi:hypothetical protein